LNYERSKIGTLAAHSLLRQFSVEFEEHFDVLAETVAAEGKSRRQSMVPRLSFRLTLEQVRRLGPAE
jgi:hypothetical protein